MNKQEFALDINPEAGGVEKQLNAISVTLGSAASAIDKEAMRVYLMQDKNSKRKAMQNLLDKIRKYARKIQNDL